MSSSAAPELALVADIGGTNARFALVEPGHPRPQLQQRQALPCADFASLQHAAEHYLDELGVRPTRAAIAVACPIRGDDVRMTNRAWAFNRSELQQCLGLQQLTVLNDFGAIARAVPALGDEDSVALTAHAPLPLKTPISILGPGTGLGVALLVGNAQAGCQVVETEGGHVSFAPQSTEEHIIARWVTSRFGRVSNERLLSGSGLSHIEAALREMEHGPGPQGSRLREPAEIVAAALAGHDMLARRTLARFCAVLGSVAGDCALLHGARSVVIAGGIVPRFIPFLRSSAFRERFLAKGRFADHLATVPIRIITHRDPGLLGAAMTLQQPPLETPP